MDDPSTTSERPRGRTARGLIIAGAAAAIVVVAIALVRMSIDRSPVSAAGRANLRALVPFWIASAVAWGMLTLLWRRLARHNGSRSAGRSTRAVITVLVVAAAARGIVLAGHDPALSDDINRYVLDGRSTAAGANPYLDTPDERAAAAEGAARWPTEADRAVRVNNPKLHTIYLPMSQWVFAAIGVITPEAWSPAAVDRLFRAAFVAFELVAIVLLLVAVRRASGSPWWVALYAWHPLPLAEIAGAGHQDVVGMTFLIAGLVLAQPAPGRCARWVWAIAAAALVKPFALPAAAFVLRGRPLRDWLRALAIGAVVTMIIAAPLLLAAGGAPLANLRATASRFALKWAHFGSVYEPLLTAIEWMTPSWTNDPQEQLARAICSAVLAGVLVIVWVRGRDVWRDLSALLLAMVLLSPTAHPWYLLWALVLFPIARSPAVWILSLTLPLGYAALADTVEWRVAWWVLVVAYAPVYGMLAVGRRP